MSRLVHNENLFATAANTVLSDPELSTSERVTILAIATRLQTQAESRWFALETSAQATAPGLDLLTGRSARQLHNVIFGRSAEPAKPGKPGKPAQAARPRKPGLVERGYLHSESRGQEENGKHRPHAYCLGWRLLGLDNRADGSIGRPQSEIGSDSKEQSKLGSDSKEQSEPGSASLHKAQSEPGSDSNETVRTRFRLNPKQSEPGSEEYVAVKDKKNSKENRDITTSRTYSSEPGSDSQSDVVSDWLAQTSEPLKPNADVLDALRERSNGSRPSQPKSSESVKAKRPSQVRSRNG